MGNIMEKFKRVKEILDNVNEQEATEYSDWTLKKAEIKYFNQSNEIRITSNFIYWADLGINIGSEQNKIRPVLVVRSHKNSNIITILPLN